MISPPPPWTFYGWAGLLADWVPMERAKEALLPLGFEKTPYCLSRTLGGHYVGCYTPAEGSAFPDKFHEFGFLSCFAKYKNRKGLHIARMAIDHAAAMEGGREGWGLDKFEAKFEETSPFGLRVVSPENKLDLSVCFKKRLPLGYWACGFNFLSALEGSPIAYRVSLKGMAWLCAAERRGFHHHGRLLPILFDRARVRISAPEAF